MQVADEVAGELPDGAAFETWITAALGANATGALAIRLVGLEEGAALNHTWRHKAGPTNVLAFPGPSGLPPGVPREYGDLVICLPVVQKEAAAQGKAPVHHLAHLVVHGTLHLLGHTHEGEADAARMEALETRVLAGLGIPDPYVVK